MHDPAEIYNWRRFDERLTTSGQPTEEQLADIHRLGVREIVNLGMHDHERALPDEPSSVASLGMAYTHIPVDFKNPTKLDFDKFCAALSSIGDQKLHVHCIANLRVTAFLYVYQRDVLGLPDSDARIVMDTVWRPGGVWARFIGDVESIELPHRPPLT